MHYLKIDNVIEKLRLEPDFQVFGDRIFDKVPDHEVPRPFMTLVVITDPPVSSVHNRARVEVRVVLEKGTKSYEARLWYQILDNFFVGQLKDFGGEEVYNIRLEDRRNFDDDNMNVIVLCDYYFDYLT